jgi:CopG-like RHH_1 or ribbon-helix-helix domain, RHH_5
MVNSRLSSVPAKIPRIAVYLSDEVKADLETLANSERRSMSQMAAILIEESIARAKADGRLNPEQQRDSQPK